MAMAQVCTFIIKVLKSRIVLNLRLMCESSKTQLFWLVSFKCLLQSFGNDWGWESPSHLTNVETEAWGKQLVQNLKDFTKPV